MLCIKNNIDQITAAELQAAMAQLPDWRREKAMKFRFHSGKCECTYAFRLLQKALPHISDITFSEDEHGKPSIIGHPEICFNLSHCKYAVACAIDSHPIGVDIECRGRYKSSLAEYTCCEAELAMINSALDPDLTFTILWTKKEALLKLIGTGITDNLKDILLNTPNVTFSTEVHDKYVCTTAQWA